ncbi:sporulation transcription factor Spo0A [Eubacteriales bacterium OttesenSCG-928-K08]|nr:sporulation transcription factor Spo0A [Eubacteriales bacterium OttesenSCG-928-K08]
MLTMLVADSSEQVCAEFEEFCAGVPAISVIGGATNGRSALETICNNNIDILLMDLLLPALDGLGVLHAIQDLPEENRPAVFIHTAFYDDRLASKLQKLNVVYCFVKPIPVDQIVSRILQLLGVLQQPSAALRQNGSAHSKVYLPYSAYDQEELNREITRQIRAIGMPAHLLGYHYLRSAIQISVEADDPSSIAVTKDIYPIIGKQCNKRPQLVERAIRNAIEIAWTRGKPEVLNQYFGYTIDDNKGKPTNAEFIAMLADRVRMTLPPRL